MKQALNIVVLAAGKGTRMRSELPKVLHPLAGRSLVEHVLATAAELSPSATCVVYGHGGDAVPQALGGRGVLFALQAPQLGTGHAVMQALPQIDVDVPTLVLYGDVPLVRALTLAPLVDAARAGALAILTATLDDPHGYGRIVREGGAVRRIVEQRDATPAEQAIREINTGIMAIPGGRLSGWLERLGNHNAQKEYYLTDVVALAVADGVAVQGLDLAENWEIAGVNSPAQLAELERVHQRRLAGQLMDAGVRLADPLRIDVRGRLVAGQDVSIDVNCVFEGEVTLGDGVSVGPHCVIRDSRIGAGTRVEAMSWMDGATVGEGAVVGPYARLRPGTDLAAGAHVGNFVELKNSQVGAGSKINHLSYVGDATVGARVNIGAGTITCNYDGANKYRTVIGDDAFIGSDTQLVAPVRVGAGATIGAGSTITRDAPPAQLTLSRNKQYSLSGWKRPQKKS
ncbi:MAG: bifunctional UDP-N-acetylglucosamine diphosphorylase/glucosamine-1-phosphate N-acetyltransferase GlmU [Burkholderiales bacterium]|nr:bifunctional UDP-N-acetylglucosamine diphosphorylase/glucosamine-1-phosphate N-acetyltransferase GlmU [Burkholderiales bacterium]